MKNVAEKIVAGDWVSIKKDVASVDTDNPVAFHENRKGVVKQIYKSGLLLVDVKGYQMLTYDPNSLTKTDERG